MSGHRTFIIRKLHSLSGVIPLGLFLVEHMLLNSFALKGPEAYNNIIESMNKLPYLLPIELMLILIPLTYHGIYGLWITYTAKTNVFKYTYYRNWMFYLQRAAGVITFIFVFYHVYSLRLKSLLFGQEVSFVSMAGQIESSWMFLFYLIGLVASFYHFANGLFTFSITWGITVGPNSQRVANIATWIVFITMTVVGVNALVAFR